MIRSTRAVSKRISIDYSELSDSEPGAFGDVKMSKRKKKALFLKNLDNQVEATKKKIKREQAAYINSIMCMYNTLIGKIPKAIQDLPVNQFIANDGHIEERPEAENVQILSRPSEIIDFHTMPRKRLIRGKTPAKPDMPPPDDDVIFVSAVAKAQEKTTSKIKATTEKLPASTRSCAKRAPPSHDDNAFITPMETSRPKRVLRSTAKNSTLSTAALSTAKSTRSKKLSPKKLNTPLLGGTAPAAKKSSMISASGKQKPTTGRVRSSSQWTVSAKSRKMAVPLRQRNQPASSNSSKSSFSSQTSHQRKSPDENSAPSFDSITLLTSGNSNHPCRPGEKVLRLQDASCPLAMSQPAIICPLEDGNALTLSCDTDFESLTLPEGVMDSLRSFQKKLCTFLRIPGLSDN